MNRSFFALFVLTTTHCGIVASEPPVTEPSPVDPWTETASCTEVRATCGGDPAMTVQGLATDLASLDGARVEFAVRYLLEEDKGLGMPHGVARGRTHVKDGAFETCVCVPHGANMYPEIAAVVYRPGTTGETSANVARAMFSQRYATLGTEDVTYALAALPSDGAKAAALAGMSPRTATVVVGNLAPFEGHQVLAGLVADERPVTAQVAFGGVEGGKLSLTWTMPGRAWSSERVALFVDRNKNGKCDAGDAGTFASFAGTIEPTGPWLEGAALAPVCDAVAPGASRE